MVGANAVIVDLNNKLQYLARQQIRRENYGFGDQFVSAPFIKDVYPEDLELSSQVQTYTA